jgi:hypothetical protein
MSGVIPIDQAFAIFGILEDRGQSWPTLTPIASRSNRPSPDALSSADYKPKLYIQRTLRSLLRMIST